MIELKKGDIVKHFKGKDLIEKNIYQILAVNPVYTGTKEFSQEAVVIYEPLFQTGKAFVREYADLVSELSDEQKEVYDQCYRVEHLTEAELVLLKSPTFIRDKKAYIEKKEQEQQNNNEKHL